MKTLKRVSSVLVAFVLAITFMVSGVADVLAAEPTWGTTLTTNASGVVSQNKGSGKITIVGQPGQSLIGKKFNVYQLMWADENLTGGTNKYSINYNINSRYMDVLKTVTLKWVQQKDPSSTLRLSDMTEYYIIDFMQTLSTPHSNNSTIPNNGANTSEVRNYLEEVRNAIRNSNATAGAADFSVNVTRTTNTNSVVLDSLQTGYYLIDEISDVDSNGNEHFAKAVIMAQTAGDTDVEVYIKSDYPTLEKKIFEDDNNVGWNDVADYDIGQKVPFKIETSVPNMNGYDSYRYIIHDSLDEELTFDPASVEVKFVAGNTTKVVPRSMYSIDTTGSSLDTGDTFVIRFTDASSTTGINNFKHVFASVMGTTYMGTADTNGNYPLAKYHDTKVVTTYNARLNEKAALDLFIPGYENDARLEFSNDPDYDKGGDTGYTPWDTVVCFTYSVGSNKVNENNVVLEGAEFRLYRDEACTQEIALVRGTSQNQGDDLLGAKGGSSQTWSQADLGTHLNGSGGTFYQENGAVRNEIADYTSTNSYLVQNAETGATGTPVKIVTDSQGYFNIAGLDKGTYYLKEIKAPIGYRLLLDPIKITITPAEPTTTGRDDYIPSMPNNTLFGTAAPVYKVTIESKNFYDGQFFHDKAEITNSVETGNVDFTILNEVGVKLPVTGSEAMLYLLGAGLLLTCGALIVARKKSN